MSEREPEPATTEMPSATEGATAAQWSSEPVVLRHADVAAGVLLLLAGVAALASLFLPWLADGEDTGLDLVRGGLSAPGDLVDTGLWQPLAIVLGGAVLLVLGLMMFRSARDHRAVGWAALGVSALVAWALAVPLVAAALDLGFFDVGFWCAIVVAVLGLLGAGQALLTRPRTG